MKTLIISDSNEDINFISSFVECRGYDVIVYRKLLKAMDNIEEIKPDVIMVTPEIYNNRINLFDALLQSNAVENMKIYLYSGESSLENSDVTKALGFKYITVLNKNNIEDYFPCENITKGNYDVKDGQVIITNPKDGSLLSGRVISVSGETFDCNIGTDDLQEGQILQYVSVSYNGNVSALSTKVIKNNRELEVISLSICKYYEKI